MGIKISFFLFKQFTQNRRYVVKSKRKIIPYLAVLSIFLFLGCAWQKLPPEPIYTSIQSPIPINIGIRLSGDPSSVEYGPPVIEQLKNLHVFKSVSYPYEGGKVDAILNISIKGQWKPDGTNVIKGIAIGLSLFTLSPVIGPSMTGHHEIGASMNKGQKEIGRYQFEEDSKVSWGLGANTGEVTKNVNQNLIHRISNKLAEMIQQDWPRISSEFKRRKK
jgi:hypothetical protein